MGEDEVEHIEVREKANRVNERAHGESCDPPFTIEELRWAASSFNPKKAPGPDGFTADICNEAIAQDPEMFLALVNKCLSLSCFPKMWKRATVVVLRKPGKADYTHPKSYRPIGLLPILGKILEKMLIRRIRWHTLPDMSDRQYGFTPQRSTEDSLYVMIKHVREKLKEKKLITLVSLDIEGAFDSAWWPAIRCRLAETKCPANLRRLVDSYLSDREVRVRYAGEECAKVTTKGCVQGSIGGPTFWNILLDPLLKELEGRGDYCQAFADDVVLIFSGDSALEVQRQANATLAYVRSWGVKNKLKFAPQKTKAMVITNKLKYDSPILSMGGEAVELSREIKILGLTIDDKLTFKSHVSNVCRKAINTYKQLSRAAKIHWGLSPEIIRTIYVAVVEPIIMYAASAWAPAANKVGVQKQLAVVQRGFAQKLCKAYRTVSLNSALVLSGLLPLDLRVREAALLYEAKKGVSRAALPGDREAERMTAAAGSPHPATLSTLQYRNLVNQEELDSCNVDVQIFTDGSKIGGGVGASLSIWRDGTETRALKLALSDYCTVYQAELLAIARATREVTKLGASSFGVFSDSMAALQTVVNPGSLHPLAVEARDNIKTASRLNKVVNLFWVKAHVGLPGNERADQLAKEAAEDSKRKPAYDRCPISFIKRNIRMGTLDEWNNRYITSDTASVTKLFFPDVRAAYSAIRRVGIDGLKTQIMTGHGGFSEYLYRFKRKENPSCICDPEAAENIPHLIFHCPQFAYHRFVAENKLNIKISPDNIRDIIKGKDAQTFLDYCKQIVKITIDRNKTA